MRRIQYLYFSALLSSILFACSDDVSVSPNNPELDDPADYAAEWYAGGELGTVFNYTSHAYEQATPATEQAGMYDAFKKGEYFFKKDYKNTSAGAFKGLGPLYIRRGCLYCHPSYGHGKRQDRYRADDMGNGYLLVITDETDTYLSSLTGMPQTMAVKPFKAPINEDGIHITWMRATDEWGNKFDDGEAYDLIYPEVVIDEDAFYVPLQVTSGGVITDVPYSNVKVRLESTIGIYGTGLLDAIDDEDILAEYKHQESIGVQLNPAMYSNGEFTNYYVNTLQGDGTKFMRRFTYAISRGSLQDGAGSNAIWNITNVTRSDRMYHYMTKTYAQVASKDPEVQADFYKYFPEQNITGDVETDIYNYLIGSKDVLKEPEMSDEDYKDFMVWHRGLAVPAARDLDDADVQKGKKIFNKIGCAYCHKPSWNTGDDHIKDPNKFFKDADNELPRYPNQTIWPYTDMVQHRLFMQNDIRTGWCRTTPLWGRGLSKTVTGAEERLHDCRARNVIEAIMWHGYSPQSDARRSVEKFRSLTKKERECVEKFINAI